MSKESPWTSTQLKNSPGFFSEAILPVLLYLSHVFFVSLFFASSLFSVSLFLQQFLLQLCNISSRTRRGEAVLLLLGACAPSLGCRGETALVATPRMWENSEPLTCFLATVLNQATMIRHSPRCWFLRGLTKCLITQLFYFYHLGLKMLTSPGCNPGKVFYCIWFCQISWCKPLCDAHSSFVFERLPQTLCPRQKKTKEEQNKNQRAEKHQILQNIIVNTLLSGFAICSWLVN